MKLPFLNRVIAGLLVVCLGAGGAPAAAAEPSAGEKAFPQVREYAHYQDVTEQDWFFEAVKLCQETGIMTGAENNKFAPRDYVTAFAAVTIACRLHRAYHGLPPIEPYQGYVWEWFVPYREYALAQDIIDDPFTKESATLIDRVTFVTYLVKALPQGEFPPINQISAVPGLRMEEAGAADVLTLYNAGILTGTDRYGSFSGESYISRQEVSAILCRVIRPETRVAFELEPPQPPELTPLPFLSDPIRVDDFDGSTIYVRSPQGRAAFDLTGKLLVPWQERFIIPGGEGMMRVNRGDYSGSPRPRIVYYNSEGIQISPTEYFAGTSFRQGLAAVQETELGPISLLDQTGRVVATYANELKQRVHFAPSDGWLVLDGNEASGNKATALNLSSLTLTVTPYRAIWPFSDGRARAVNDNFDLFCFLDTDLQEAFPQKYEAAGDFVNGLAIVGNVGEGAGVIDPSGQVVLPFQYHFYGTINREGKVVARMLLDDVWQSCVIDTSGQILGRLPMEGNVYFRLYDGGIILMQRDISYYSLLDDTGKDLLGGLLLQNVFVADNQTAIVEIEDEYFLFSK